MTVTYSHLDGDRPQDIVFKRSVLVYIVSTYSLSDV